MRRKVLTFFLTGCLAFILTLITGKVDLYGNKSSVPIPEPAFEIDHTRTDLSRAVRPFDREYDGPVIDTHVHLDPPREGVVSRKDLKEIVQVITDSDVDYAIFMPTPNEGRTRNHEVGVKQKLTLQKMGKGRIRLSAGSDYITYWLHRAYRDGYSEKQLKKILKRISSDLDGGLYSGIGEIGVYHFNKGGRQMVIEYQPNFEPFLKIVDFIAQRGAILDLHIEPVEPEGRSREDEAFGGLELLFRRNPDLKIILSHTGMTYTSNARKLLDKYPNMMMILKIFKRHRKWRNLEPIINRRGEIYEDWARLFEQMPERFMIGTDAKFGRTGKFTTPQYKQDIVEIRLLLGSLKPDAARRIAYENASLLFKDSGN